jgi:hypothetical protein
MEKNQDLNVLKDKTITISLHGQSHTLFMDVGKYENSDIRQELKNHLVKMANQIYQQGYKAGELDAIHNFGKY